MTSNRAISTVLDVSVCLLLVSASVLTLVDSPALHQSNPPDAGETATMLTTATATVNYTVDGSVERTTHGTLAALLTGAALSATVVNDVELRADESFERVVVSAVEQAVRQPGRRTQVVARWRPYSGAHVHGQVTAGDDPPPNQNVRAATLTVPVNSKLVDGRVTAAARNNGYEGVAAVLAPAILTAVLPPDIPTSTDQYQRTADVYDVDVTESDSEQTRRRIRAAIAAEVEAELHREFDNPVDAAEASSFTEIQIVVRTWSP